MGAGRVCLGQGRWQWGERRHLGTKNCALKPLFMEPVGGRILDVVVSCLQGLGQEVRGLSPGVEGEGRAISSAVKFSLWVSDLLLRKSNCFGFEKRPFPEQGSL